MKNAAHATWNGRHPYTAAACTTVALALTSLIAGCGDANKGYTQQQVALCGSDASVRSVLATDLDGDGVDDMAVGCRTDADPRTGRLEVWLSDGSGKLNQSQAVELGSFDTGGEGANIATAADFNEDGNLDLLITDHAGVNHRDAIVYGRENARFGKPEYVSFDREDWLTGSDVDGNGHQDLIIVETSAFYTRLYYLQGTGGRLDTEARKGRLARKFNDKKAWNVDVNGDGLADTVVLLPTAHTLRVYSSRGTRHDLPMDKSKTVITRVLSGGPADGDDVNDLLVKTRNADNQTQVRWLLTEGGPHFGEPIVRASKEDVRRVTDYNGDGQADLLLKPAGKDGAHSKQRTLLMGQTGGGFRKAATLQWPDHRQNRYSGDFNADGMPDFAYTYRDDDNKQHTRVYISRDD